MYKKDYLRNKGKHCCDCGILITNKAMRCRLCSWQQKMLRQGKLHPNWKGGRNTDQFGYIRVQLLPGDPYYAMSQKGKKMRCGTSMVYEHRLVMAKHLGRLLKPDEPVHHLNGVKHDNRIENLCLLSPHTHHSKMLLQAVQERVRMLERWIEVMQQTKPKRWAVKQ